MISIGHFENELDAKLAQEKLSEAGIDSSLKGETFAHIHPVVSTAGGGISLWINEENKEQAQQILQNTQAPFDQAATREFRKTRINTYFKVLPAGIVIILLGALIWYSGPIVVERVFYWIDTRNYHSLFLLFIAVEGIRYLFYRSAVKAKKAGK